MTHHRDNTRASLPATGGQRHWNAVYASGPADQRSWYQPEPTTSLRLITSAVPPSAAVVDVGGGTSRLVDRLVAAGYADVTVVDLSATALDQVGARLDPAATGTTLVRADLRDWQPGRRFDLWHDRATFHFLVDPADRRRYVTLAARALRPGGILILGTFGPHGPTSCSGLPTARYHPEQLAAQFASVAELRHSELELHHTPAGALQPFTWVELHRP